MGRSCHYAPESCLVAAYPGLAGSSEIVTPAFTNANASATVTGVINRNTRLSSAGFPLSPGWVSCLACCPFQRTSQWIMSDLWCELSPQILRMMKYQLVAGLVSESIKRPGKQNKFLLWVHLAELATGPYQMRELARGEQRPASAERTRFRNSLTI
jgi:hypothetical protein